MANYILVMDQGTTGSRGVIYDEKGKIVAFDYEEYEQFFPNSGWCCYFPFVVVLRFWNLSFVDVTTCSTRFCV